MSINNEMFKNARAKTLRRATFDGDAFLIATNFSLSNEGEADFFTTIGDKPIVLDTLRTTTESGDYTISLYENTEATGGTEVPYVNADRTSNKQTLANSVYANPTVSDVGDLLLIAGFGGSNTGNTRNSTKLETPFIMKPNTSYLFRWTHNGSGSRDFTITGSFFPDNR